MHGGVQETRRARGSAGHPEVGVGGGLWRQRSPGQNLSAPKSRERSVLADRGHRAITVTHAAARRCRGAGAAPPARGTLHARLGAGRPTAGCLYLTSSSGRRGVLGAKSFAWPSQSHCAHAKGCPGTRESSTLEPGGWSEKLPMSLQARRPPAIRVLIKHCQPCVSANVNTSVYNPRSCHRGPVQEEARNLVAVDTHRSPYCATNPNRLSWRGSITRVRADHHLDHPPRARPHHAQGADTPGPQLGKRPVAKLSAGCVESGPSARHHALHAHYSAAAAQQSRPPRMKDCGCVRAPGYNA
jgi:hypothetical protein